LNNTLFSLMCLVFGGVNHLNTSFIPFLATTFRFFGPSDTLLHICLCKLNRKIFEIFAHIFIYLLYKHALEKTWPKQPRHWSRWVDPRQHKKLQKPGEWCNDHGRSKKILFLSSWTGIFSNVASCMLLSWYQSKPR